VTGRHDEPGARPEAQWYPPAEAQPTQSAPHPVDYGTGEQHVDYGPSGPYRVDHSSGPYRVDQGSGPYRVEPGSGPHQVEAQGAPVPGGPVPGAPVPGAPGAPAPGAPAGANPAAGHGAPVPAAPPNPGVPNPGAPGQYQYAQPYQGRPTHGQPAQAAQYQQGQREGQHDLSSAQLLRQAKRAPQSGWRRALYVASGHAVNLGESPADRVRRELIERINQPLNGCYKIAALSLKGGVGKTTTTTALGSTLSSLRGDRVIAVDANPDRGTLL
jgi:hypothetical protein